MYELRDYQKEAVDLAVEYIFNRKNNAKPIIVAPTGAGKSLYIANIIKNSGKKAIVLQPNVELLLQNYEKYIEYGFEASIYSNSAGEKNLSDVVFATIGSLISISDEILRMKYDIILVDECHYMCKKGSQVDRFIKHTKIKKVIGLTATPIMLYNFMGDSGLAMINR
ncbi:MAG: DEAD/DEAH box helicase family protein, partial [Vicingus serpentipes]|nr:DEAD/DEAH box helicase family protein [Vicingus serpentipes]